VIIIDPAELNVRNETPFDLQMNPKLVTSTNSSILSPMISTFMATPVLEIEVQLLFLIN